VTGEWKEVHSEDLLDLCSSPDIFRMMKSSGNRLAGHVACFGGEERCIQSFAVKI
jgi:hypothetical protein